MKKNYQKPEIQVLLQAICAWNGAYRQGRWPTFLRLGIMSKLLLRSAYRNVRLEVRGLSFVP